MAQPGESFEYCATTVHSGDCSCEATCLVNKRIKNAKKFLGQGRTQGPIEGITWQEYNGNTDAFIESCGYPKTMQGKQSKLKTSIARLINRKTNAA